MLDPKYFREKLNETAHILKKRGFHLDTTQIQSLEERRKTLQVQTQDLQQERNQLSKKIGQAKAQGHDDAQMLVQVNQVGDELKALEIELENVASTLQTLMAATPNLLDDSVPEGMSDADNVEIKKVGTPKVFDFVVKDHVALGEPKAWFDFEASAKISGSRFMVLHGDVAHLHRALIQFMLDVHTQAHGFREIYVPYLVNSDSLFGTGQLPKFKDDQFKIAGEQDLWLIPTAEVPVTNLMRDAITTIDQLPLKYVAHTPCFRSEVGSYGKDTRGMFRQHQFEKVELVMMVHPADSEKYHEELTRCAEIILEKLELPYRRMVLCGGDTGFSSRKTYDLEVWLPGQNCYREVSSCSQFGDFQARRMKARFRNPETAKPEYLHTLNGSGLAVGRTLIAVLENYQNQKGDVYIPTALQPYLQGKDVI